MGDGTGRAWKNIYNSVKQFFGFDATYGINRRRKCFKIYLGYGLPEYK